MDKFRLSEGHLAAWEVTAAVLSAVDRDELELLPDIMASVHAPAGRIGGVPGALDFDLASVQSWALAIFGCAVTCLQAGAPKLFDAALDVGKDTAKKMVDRHLDGAPAAATDPAPAATPAFDSARLHDLIRVAALERRLSPATADALANAVIARLAMKPAAGAN